MGKETAISKFLFGFSNWATSGTTVKTVMKVAGQSGKAFEVVWIYLGGAATVAPQDFAYQAQVGWVSNATIGTPSSVPVPIELNYSGPTSVLSCGIAYTAEPTTYDAYVVPLFGHNNRGGMLFQVPRGEGFITGAASAMGLGVRTICNTSGNMDGSLMYHEP